MKTLYLDIFSGISGDMFIGALLDLGLEFASLEAGLAKLGLDEYHLHVAKSQRMGIAGTKFDVHTESQSSSDTLQEHTHGHEHHDDHSHRATDGPVHDHHRSERSHTPGELAHPSVSSNPHLHQASGHPPSHSHCHSHGRSFGQICELIERSGLSPWVKQKSTAVFRRLAEAEGKIHGKPPEEVHFHEVGAVDSIVDVVGGCIGLELLGRPRVLASRVIEGTGWVNCAHGRFPIPAPATLEILAARGVAISQCDEPAELVTPTGAALLAEFAENFGLMQDLVGSRIGYGLGTRENKTRPNVLRAVLGNADPNGATHDWETDTVTVLETNLDDLNPEILGSFLNAALEAGALDAFHTPIHMKKNRPGVLLTVMCQTSDADKFSALILRETSAFGVRRHSAERRKLKREVQSVETTYGTVSVKVGRLDGAIVQASPEFECCRRLAEQARVPLKKIYDAALRAFEQKV